MPKLIDHNERRAEIVSAAWDLIAADGIHGATVRHVARRAGVAAGSVRYVFPTQDELLLAVVAELEARSEAGVARRRRDYSRPDQAVKRLVVSLPTGEKEKSIRRVERSLRFAIGQVPTLEGAVASLREARARECSDVLVTLAHGLDVSERGVAFEVRRTLALVEGLGEQLIDGGRAVNAIDAHAVLDAHLRSVNAHWKNQRSDRKRAGVRR